MLPHLTPRFPLPPLPLIQNRIQTEEIRLFQTIEVVGKWVVSSGGIYLCDVLNLIGKYQTNSDIEAKLDQIDYRNFYIELNEALLQKPREKLSLYISKLFVFWPENTGYRLQILYGGTQTI